MCPRPGLNLGVWRTELVDDADRECLFKWAEIGFLWVWHCWQWCPGCTGRGGKSSVCQARIPKLLSKKQQVLHEIYEGNYIVCDSKPNFISPLGAIPKSLNDYATLEFSQRFQTIDNATSLLQPGYYMAKIDLKSAYRSVSISAESQQFTGLKICT